MNLKEFLDYKKMNIRELAKYLNLSAPTIYKVVRGQDIKLSTAFHIQKTTRGKVKISDIHQTYLENISIKKTLDKSVKQKEIGGNCKKHLSSFPTTRAL